MRFNFSIFLNFCTILNLKLNFIFLNLVANIRISAYRYIAILHFDVNCYQIEIRFISEIQNRKLNLRFLKLEANIAISVYCDMPIRHFNEIDYLQIANIEIARF